MLLVACLTLGMIEMPRVGAAEAAAPIAMPASIEQAESDALQWLLGQMVPNDVVPSPDRTRRSLLLSYRIPADDPNHRYLNGRSFVYDNALAAIAFTMLGRNHEAESVLNALGRLVRPDGSLWFGYNTQNRWPTERDHEGAIVRTGAVAWVGYAFTYYLGARSLGQPDLVSTDAVASRYLRVAQTIAGWMLTRQVGDRSDPRFGLLTGGAGASTVSVAGSTPAEGYDAAEVRWVSTEHNLDSWFFLRDLARITGRGDLEAAAETVRGRLMSLWSETDAQFVQGIHETGKTDTALPLDCASWGALLLAAQGRDEQARRCVAAMQARFSYTPPKAPAAAGYRPYGPEPVYADPRVNSWYFPDAPGKLWQELPFVWAEGSLGAAAALARTGRTADAAAVIDAMRSLAIEGGLRYAAGPVDFQFTDYPSVASTAWYIIAVEVLRGSPWGSRFWGP